MRDPRPEKIHLIPDEHLLVRLGRAEDGRLVYQETQVHFDGRVSHDFVVTYVFDADGALVEDHIDAVGVRGERPADALRAACMQHEERFGHYQVTEIWVRPFSIERHGLRFGFVARHLLDEEGLTEDERLQLIESLDDGDDGWRVEAMPGNTLQFYPPWEEGGYDT